jgi:7-cyano-7-deazaguanine reductase
MEKIMNDTLIESPLGKKTAYINEYSKELLFPVSRQLKRNDIHLSSNLPFKGIDVWNGFELSWLNEKGKPVIALAQFIFPCESPQLIESKSFKLYLNSFNQTKFSSIKMVQETLEKDLSQTACADIKVKLIFPKDAKIEIQKIEGECLDDLDISCDTYLVHPEFLQVENIKVEEILFSDLLKSNCLMTGQPDWGTLQISYSGKKINHEGLLKYIISFRNHSGFAEHCVERIFMDILQRCAPEKLTILGCYTRRGGLGITPIRSTESFDDWSSLTENYLSGNLRLLRE